MSTILDLIQTDTRHTFRRVANKNGGEYAGPCPACSGRDRFHVWPETGRYWCRQCGAKGDTIQYYRDFKGMTFRQACEAVGRQIGAPPAPRAPTPPPDEQAPSATWQGCARAFVDYCLRIRTDEHPATRHLRRRGFSLDTLEAAGIGYNPETLFRDRERWGLPPATNKKGHAKKIWLPRGVVIPVYVGAELWQVIIRRPNGDLTGGENKYVHVEGGAGSVLYNADGLRPGKPAMVVEGYLDALAVQQAAGDLVNVVAAGTTTGARRLRWVTRLALANPVLVAFDADDAGEQAADWWLAGLGRVAKRWRPLFDDPAAMLEADSDVRAWVEAGLR